jgi:hypothetical protein
MYYLTGVHLLQSGELHEAEPSGSDLLRGKGQDILNLTELVTEIFLFLLCMQTATR